MSQWVPTSGPFGGYTDDIVQVGNVLVLSGVNAGIYTSGDYGLTWTNTSYGLYCNRAVTALAEENGLVYATVAGSGVYISYDQGYSWDPISTGVENKSFYDIDVVGTNIYAVTADGRFFYSPDNGVTWGERSGWPTSVVLRHVIVHDNVVYVGGERVYKSSDNGITWEEVNIPGLTLYGIDAMGSDGTTLVLGSMNTVYISQDHFATMDTVLYNTVSSSNTTITVFNDNFYITTGEGRYFVSGDNGYTWAPYQISQTERFLQDIHITPTTMIASTYQGVFMSLDMGATWVFNSQGVAGTQVEVLEKFGGYVYAGTYGQGIFRSNNGGQSWEEINNGLNSFNDRSITEIVVLGSRLYISTRDDIYYSDDLGDSWIKSYDPGLNTSIGDMSEYNGILVAGETDTGVVVSVDGGNTWNTAQNVGLDTQTYFSSILLHQNTIVMSTANGKVFRSENMGDSWTELTITSGYYGVLDFKLDNGILYASTTKGVFQSTDMGNTWSLFGNATYYFDEILIDGNLVYGTSRSGVYVADKTQQMWYRLCDGMGDKRAISLLLDGDTLYAGTFAAGVWKRKAVSGTLPPEDGPTVGVAPLKVCPSGSPVDLFEAIGISRDRPGSWSPALKDPDGMFDPAVDTPGLYTYTFDNDICSCPDYRKIEVSLGGDSAAGTDSEAVFCKSDVPVHLLELMGGAPGEGGEWSPRLSSGTDLFDPSADPGGIYTYTVAQDGCASVSAKFTVVLNDAPYAGENGEVEVCEGISGYDLTSALGGVPDTGGIWLPALSSGSAVFDANTDPPGIYTYIVGNGSCKDTSEVEVRITKLPDFGSTERIAICRNGGSVDLLEVLGDDMPDSGTWVPSLNGHQFDPSVHSSGTYTYTISNSCGTATSEIEVVLGESYPFDDYHISIEEFANRNRIVVSVGTDAPFEYSIDGTYFQESGVFDGLEGGVYKVTGREINGCGVFKQDILILDYPRFFTPNGDGVHETWSIEGIPPGDYQLYIYDRYGKLLEVLNPLSPGWDGNYKGIPMPVNDYWFHLKLADGRIKKGHFTLKR